MGIICSTNGAVEAVNEQSNGYLNPTFQITGEVQESLYDVIRTAGNRVDQILIGDTDHTNKATCEFLGSEALFKSFAEAGCLHTCVEVPPLLDDLFQQYYNGNNGKIGLSNANNRFENVKLITLVYNT